MIALLNVCCFKKHNYGLRVVICTVSKILSLYEVNGVVHALARHGGIPSQNGFRDTKKSRKTDPLEIERSYNISTTAIESVHEN